MREEDSGEFFCSPDRIGPIILLTVVSSLALSIAYNGDTKSLYVVDIVVVKCASNHVATATVFA